MYLGSWKISFLISKKNFYFKGEKWTFFFEGLGVEFPILISNFDNL